MANEVVTSALDRVASGQDLSVDEAAAVLREIMEGRVSEVQTAGFLIALRTKGETVDEVAGLASTMRQLATRVELRQPNVVDTAGTGGGAPSFNVSTTAALLAAAAGGTIAKHRDRTAPRRGGFPHRVEALRGRNHLEAPADAPWIAGVGVRLLVSPLHPHGT